MVVIEHNSICHNERGLPSDAILRRFAFRLSARQRLSRARALQASLRPTQDDIIIEYDDMTPEAQATTRLMV